ncbi:hypothetical protein HanXRQr2_Chr09g0393131 [Helianthus annuus]|uniref:Uncharacterized protein n=1 Tax=Helianthus annuus TaxID=4232 RepID=A0A9K3I6C1_HELAN|nr:hypothetical protein HanXRQr2_Chr09g0393131 [Helianthus annuus]
MNNSHIYKVLERIRGPIIFPSAMGSSPWCFMVFATDSTSFSFLICKIEPGAGAKS